MLKVLYGNEPYLIRCEIEKAKASVDDMNFSEFDELSDNVYELAFQYPFMTNKQVLVVSLEKLPDNDFVDRLKNIPSFTELYLLPSKVDKRTGVYKKLNKMGVLQEINKLDNGHFLKLCSQFIQREGSSISDEVLRYFSKYIGYADDEEVTLFSVEIAIKQLCHSSKEINIDDIHSLVKRTTNQKTWELSSVLLSLDGKKLYKLSNQFLSERESPIGMLSLLLRTFRLAYKASLLKGEKPKQIEEHIGVPIYQFKDALRFRPETLSKVMDILQQGVNRIKGGCAEPEVVFRATLGQVYLELSA